MAETKKPQVKINLWSKSLFYIGKELLDLGWKKNPSALQGISLNAMMISGNEDSATFWHHVSSGIDSSGGLKKTHKDTLKFDGKEYKRHCIYDGEETVFSREA